MNTSELTAASRTKDFDPRQLEALAAAAAGLPDPAVLARLANEFFNESASLPAAAPVSVDGLVLPTSAASIPAAESAVAAASSASAVAPAESELRQSYGAAPVVAPLTTPVTTAGVSTPTSFNSPGIPGGYPGIEVASGPAFSFLEEARTLFATPPAVPVHAATAPIPTERLATLNPGLRPTVPAAYADATSPQVAGAIAPAFDRSISFAFLDDIKPLGPITVAPTIEPLSAAVAPGIGAGLSSAPFDVAAIRRDFPIFQEQVNGRPLIWLDNAATTQKPQAVIDRLSYFYAHENSNIHRAAHTLAARATDAYEAAREKVRRFLNATSVREIIFVRGATEAINLVAKSWGKQNVQKGDEIVVTHLEHHANIVPWQMLCAEKGARLRVAPVDNTGQIILEEYEKLLNSHTKLVSIAQVSNALGTVTPVEAMTAAAHRHGAKVLIDGAQAVSHMQVDVQAYDCDFYVFSGHKVFAPTGIGVVFGKADVLDATPPWQGGGNMIADVTFEKTVYNPPPSRFEAGTGNIADAVGLGAAIDYVERIGMANIARYEHDLLVYATDALRQIPGLRLIGTAREKASVLSFVLDGYRTEDVGAALNREGIAVRSGHHCAQPILRRFGVESTVRPSLAFYNTCEEIDALVNAVWNLKSGRHPGV